MGQKSLPLKVFIIGNGFDRAHKLDTDYGSFIYWKFEIFVKNEVNRINNYPRTKTKLNEPSSSLCFSIIRETLTPVYIDLEKINIMFKSKESLLKIRTYINNLPNIRCSITANFIKEYFDTETTWGDIEHAYCQELKNALNKNLSSASLKSILKNTNDQLSELTIDLERYLVEVQNNQSYIPQFEDLLCSNQKVSGVHHLFINFNYTNTLEKYIKGKKNVTNFHIHGKINDVKNPIIFGLGDEYSDYFKEFKESNEDEFLKNVKSIKYLKSNVYKNLISMLNRQVLYSTFKSPEEYKTIEFEINIIGHSCSLSDRTLLKEIFNLSNCKSINVYHWNKLDSFIKSLYGIIRYFDKPEEMRDKVQMYDERKCIPQLIEKSLD